MIDFHCHLDLYPDPVLAARQAHEAGVFVLAVTTAPKAWRKSSELAQGYDRIRTGLGLHPEVAHQRAGELELFDSLLPEAAYVGEIGLDGSPHVREHAAIQQKVFKALLKTTAKHGGRIASIHSRGAVSATLEILRKSNHAVVPVLHWFTGSPAQAQAAIEMGCWFSVGPPMLRSAGGRALLSVIPKNRILTETDGPFAQLEGRKLVPSDSWMAVSGLSKQWAVDQSEVEAQLAANLKQICSLLIPVRSFSHPARG